MAETKKKDTGIVNIHGKNYETVALRIQKFREDKKDWRLVTDIINRDEKCVVMRASIYDAKDRLLATGHSEEFRAASNINRTSALENAETSAIGRCLALVGYAGTEFSIASANEVQNAVETRQAMESQPMMAQQPPEAPAIPVPAQGGPIAFETAQLRLMFVNTLKDTFSKSKTIEAINETLSHNMDMLKKMKESGSVYERDSAADVQECYRLNLKRLKAKNGPSAAESARQDYDMQNDPELPPVLKRAVPPPRPEDYGVPLADDEIPF